jgi:hypothetical protein
MRSPSPSTILVVDRVRGDTLRAALHAAETQEESLVIALALCPLGEVVSLHTEDCAISKENPKGCTCDPEVHTPGPRA